MELGVFHEAGKRTVASRERINHTMTQTPQELINVQPQTRSSSTNPQRLHLTVLSSRHNPIPSGNHMTAAKIPKRPNLVSRT